MRCALLPPIIISQTTMKKTALLVLVAITSLVITGCRSPKGNLNYQNIGKGRPNLIQ